MGDKILVPHDEQRGHYAVTKMNDDGTVHVKHDETGHEMDLNPARFHDLLAHSHEEGLRARHAAEDSLPMKGSSGKGKAPPTIDKDAVYATLLQGSGIQDHDFAQADQRYTAAKKGGKRTKLKPWKGGELDSFRQHAGKAGKKFSSMREAFDHAMQGVKTWRDVQNKIVPMMREVPGLERVHLPMEALTRHAFQDRELQEHADSFDPSHYGTTSGAATQPSMYDEQQPAEDDGAMSWWGKSFGYCLSLGLFDNVDLIKARFHKYLRRVPTGNPKKPYRYIYSIASVAHGAAPSVGEKVKISDEGIEGHYEVKHVDDENVHLEHDETGKKLVVAKKNLHDLFSKEHVRNIATKHAQLQKIATAARINGTAGQQSKAVRDLDNFERTFGLQRHRPLPSPMNEAVERQLATSATTHRWREGNAKKTPGQELLEAQAQNAKLKTAGARKLPAPSEVKVNAALNAKEEADKKALEDHQAAWSPWRATMDKISKQLDETKGKTTAASQREAAKLYEQLAKDARGAGGHKGEERAGRAERMAAALHKDADAREADEKAKAQPKPVEASHAEKRATDAKRALEAAELNHDHNRESQKAADLVNDAKDDLEAAKESLEEEEKAKTGETLQRKHEFGEHVGGSRKDAAEIRKLVAAGQLDKVDYADAARYLRKDSAMPVLNAEHFKSMGASPGAAHLGLVLSSLVANKPGDSAEERKAYVEGVRLVAGALQKIRTVADAKLFQEECKRHVSNAGEHERDLTPEEKKMFADVASESYPERVRAEQGIREKIAHTLGDTGGWGVSVAERNGKRVLRWVDHKEKEAVHDIYRALGQRFIAGLNLRVPKKGDRWGRATHRFSSDTTFGKALDEAAAYDALGEGGWAQLQSRTEEKKADRQKKAGERKKPEVAPWRQSIAETPDLQGTKVVVPDIDSKDDKALFGAQDNLGKAFKFTAVQPGENLLGTTDPKSGKFSPSKAGREDYAYHLRHATMAFHDLADVLGIAPEQVSLNGRLAIAIAARGHGKANAHYEATRKIINITRFRGAGTVAHEWGHFLDNVMAEVHGGGNTSAHGAFASSGSGYAKMAPELKGAFQDVMQAITHRTPEEAARRQALNSGRMASIRGETDTLRREIAGHHRDADAAAAGTDERAAHTKLANDKIRQHEKLREEFKALTKQDAKRSEYVRHAEAFEPNNPGNYWANNHELFARAFEAFVQDKLEVPTSATSKARRNSYLVDGTRHPYKSGRKVDGEDAQVYPMGAERHRINAAFEKLIGVLRNGKHFEKALRYVISLRKAS